MPFRKIVFWIHLGAGLIAGVIITIMSATGIAIAFEEEILAWLDRDVSRIEAPAAGRAPLPVAELKRRIAEARPAFGVTAVKVSREPTAAYEFFAGREGPLYVDPYTGTMRDSRARNRARCAAQTRGLASLAWRQGRRDVGGAGRHRREQSRVSRALRDGPLSLVSAHVESARIAPDPRAGDELSRQGARFQLAQRFRLLVAAGVARVGRDRRADLVRVGTPLGVRARR